MFKAAVSQFQEREKRKFNILMFAVKERNKKTSELNIAKNTIKKLDKLDQFKCQELGRMTGRLELSWSNIKILRNRYELKNDIYICKK